MAAIVANRKMELRNKEAKLCDKFKKMFEAWKKKVEKIENHRHKLQKKRVDEKVVSDPFALGSRRPGNFFYQ